MSKRVVPRSKLSNRQLNRLIEFFALEVSAVKAAGVLGIHRHSAARIYRVIRQCMAQDCERHTPLRGDVEADESYFGGYEKAGAAEGRLAKWRSSGS